MTQPISTAYFINPSHQSVCLHVYPFIVARQRLGKNVTAATNTHAKIENLLDKAFSVRFMLYQKSRQFFPDLSRVEGGGVEYLHCNPASRRRR
jgi:hypothetical protein